MYFGLYFNFHLNTNNKKLLSYRNNCLMHSVLKAESVVLFVRDSALKKFV